MESVTTTIDQIDHARQKRYKLFSKIALFASVMGVFHTINDASLGLLAAPLIDGGIALMLFCCYLANRFGYHNAARLAGLAFLNFAFAIYACLLPKEVGVYMFYFPLIGISAAIFGPEERMARYAFIALSFVLLLSLFISDFDLIGPYSVEAEEGEIFFLINLFSSLIVMVMCVSFIIKVNEESERRLINLTDEVHTKNVSLEKTNAELDRFLYSTSHDLRSPLLSIKGLVNIARHESDQGMIRHYLGMMDERAKRLDHFIKDIIDYSKNARTDLRADVVDFARLVDEVCANLEFIEGAKQIRFERDICIAHPVVIDRQRMSIVLNNLIGNAIKYHNVQGEDPWVNIAVSNSDGHVTIKVKDNGQGISHEHLHKIFDMFYRGTDKSKGSGLGLYIVKEAVHKMNGTLEVESQVGEGTTFLVRVPLAEANAEQRHGATA